jgi:hypothetical protein
MPWVLNGMFKIKEEQVHLATNEDFCGINA